MTRIITIALALAFVACDDEPTCHDRVAEWCSLDCIGMTGASEQTCWFTHHPVHACDWEARCGWYMGELLDDCLECRPVCQQIGTDTAMVTPDPNCQCWPNAAESDCMHGVKP